MADNTATLTSEKPYGITNIKAYVPLTLDLDELNYDAWRELFETHCIGFGVLGHIDGTSKPTASTINEWRKLDSLVKLWIYGTISKSLLQMILKKGVTAHDVWQSLENLFRDNKDARAMQLDNELRNITIGDLSITDYCQRIKTISDLLVNIDAPVSEKNLVTYMINGLSDKYDMVSGIIRHSSPLPSFLQARSMLLLEEQRLSRSRTISSTHHDHSSSSTVLHTDNPRHSASKGSNPNHFSKQSHNRRDYRRNTRNDRRQNQSAYNHSQHPPSYPWTPYGWPTPWGMTPPPWTIPRPTSTPQQQQRRTTAPASSRAHAAGLFGTAPFSASTPDLRTSPTPWPWWPTGHLDQPTTLPEAFNTMSLNDPSNDGWYMDTGATNHLASNSGFPDPTTSSPM